MRVVLGTFAVILAVWSVHPEEAQGAPPPVKEVEKPEEKDEAKKEGKQEKPSDQEIVVSATKLPTPRETTGVSVTRVTAQDLEINQDNHAAEVLRMVPGAVINQSGRKGDFTQLRIRGGETDHALVMWDGWKVNNAGQQRQYNFNSLDPVGAERIEVVRGAGSALDGTDAVTGSVNLITKKGSGDPVLRASLAGGTFGTDRETLQIEGGIDLFGYHVAASRTERRGAEVKNSGFTARNYAARFDFQLHDNHAVKLIVRGSELDKGFYESNPSGYGTTIEQADPDDDLRTNSVLVGLEYTGRPVPIWETILRPGYYESETTSVTKGTQHNSPLNFALDPFGFSGPWNRQPLRTSAKDWRASIEWRNNLIVYENEDIRDVFTAGYYAEKEVFNQREQGLGVDFPPPFFIPEIVNVRNTDTYENVNQAAFVQNRIELFERAYLTAGGRYEDHEAFGIFWTARGDASFLIPESNTRIFGSAGTSFRAPAFLERFGRFGGNPLLQPEENFAWDVGLEQHFLERKITLGATYFSNDFTNLIGNTFNPVTFEFSFENVGKAATHGWEFFARFRPVKQVTLEGTATTMKARDEIIFRRLGRRPEHVFTARLTAQPLLDLVPDEYDGLELSFEFLSVSNRRDVAPLVPVSELLPFDFANAFGRSVNVDGQSISFLQHKEKGYRRFDLAAAYRFWHDRIKVFARGENIFNEQYEDVATFPADGANWLGGVELTWRF